MNPLFAALQAVIDIILPLRPRSARTQGRTVKDIRPLIDSHELLGIRITTIMDYRDRAVEDLIRALKYEQSRHAAKLAAAVLADFLYEEISSLRAFSPRPIFLVPVPLHVSRMRERGFNQIEKILNELPVEFKDGTLSRVAVDALARTRATSQQTRLSRFERLKNVEGAFAVADASIANAQVILIDDVCTTGATLANAAKTLEVVGIAVNAIALARA